MRFEVTAFERTGPEPRNVCFLMTDGWDDWGKYRTQFTVVIFDAAGKRHDAGGVKIAERGLQPSGVVSPGSRAPSLPSFFETLGEEFFSLGQREDYYRVIYSLSPDIAHEVFTALRDCAFDLSIFDKFRSESALTESLLRFVNEETIRHRFHRLAHGQVALSQFKFAYRFPDENGPVPPHIEFEVYPQSSPPTNVHVLIGRNGVGKTRCIQNMIRAIVSNGPVDAGAIIDLETKHSEFAFAGIVAVMFSTFDEFSPPTVGRSGLKAHYIGKFATPPIESQEKRSDAGDIAEDLVPPSTYDSAFVRTIQSCSARPQTGETQAGSQKPGKRSPFSGRRDRFAARPFEQ